MDKCPKCKRETCWHSCDQTPTPESTLRKAQEAVAAIAAEVRLFDGVSPRKHQIREWADQLDEIHRALAAQAGDGLECCAKGNAEGCLVCADCERTAAAVAFFEGHNFPHPGINEHADILIAALRATQPREQAGTKFGKPLDKPARVGATVFRVGVGSDLVVQRAQREYEYHLNPPPYDKAVLQAALAAAQCTCAQTPGAGCSNCPPDAAPCPRAEGEPKAPAYTTGHCENNKQPGGCQLHNLLCGWPNCDRRPAGGAK